MQIILRKNVIFIQKMSHFLFVQKKSSIFAENFRKMQKNRQIIHVEFLEKNTHYYFGSVSAIYDLFSTEEIGITYGSLRNYHITADHPYHNEKCIIRKGELFTKAGGRGTAVKKQQ